MTSDPNTVSILDIDMFKSASYGLQFAIKDVDPSDNSLSARDLSGKVIAVVFEGIFNTVLTLLSSDPVDDLGSVAEITDEEGGIASFSISASQMSLVTSNNGRWRLEEREGENEAIILIRGSVHIVNP